MTRWTRVFNTHPEDKLRAGHDRIDSVGSASVMIFISQKIGLLWSRENGHLGRG